MSLLADVKTILLVDSDEEIQKKFRVAVAKSTVFKLAKVTDSTIDALDYIKDGLPDVVITDIVHKHGEGTAFIADITKQNLAKIPYTVVITSSTSDSVKDMLKDFTHFQFSKDKEDFSADMVLRHCEIMIPYFNSPTRITQTSKELAVRITSEMERRDIVRSHVIENIANKLCTGGAFLGRKYIIECLVVGCFYNGDSELKLSRDLYPTLYKKFSTNKPNITSAIELALGNAWSKTDEDILKQVYPFPVDPERGAPTPAEFIRHVITDLKEELQNLL